jgi:hypothetical protein
MRVPAWMRLPLAALGMDSRGVELAYEARVYDDWIFSLPTRPARGMTAAADILGRLFEANLLNVDLPTGPVLEGETILVRGLPMRVKHVQDRRLVLELPLGRRFRRPEDWRAAREEIGKEK